MVENLMYMFIMYSEMILSTERKRASYFYAMQSAISKVHWKFIDFVVVFALFSMCCCIPIVIYTIAENVF